MAAIFSLPWAGVTISSGDLLYFYDAGTTTPQAVYSDSGLSTAISQPVTADSDGVFEVIYLTTGTFKVALKTSAGVTRYTADNVDGGIPAGSGALAVANGGTAATTAAGARTNLAAAAQTEVDALSSSVSDIEGQIDDVGGTLGALAGLDTLTDELGTGFGVVLKQNALVDSDATVVTCSGTIPYDNSIPQNSEGTEVLSGSFTPQSASSILEIEVYVVGALSTSANVCVALFKDTTADAIASVWSYNVAQAVIYRLRHRMASPGTSAVTFAVRAGGSTGTFYVNGNSSGTRVGGGVQLASILVKELLTY